MDRSAPGALDPVPLVSDHIVTNLHYVLPGPDGDRCNFTELHCRLASGAFDHVTLLMIIYYIEHALHF